NGCLTTTQRCLVRWQGIGEVGMNIVGRGRRVRIYTGETAQWGRQPLFLAVLEFLRSEGAAGATVTRGAAGFGATSRIHTATLFRLSEDLPMVIDWVDAPERVER